jgi:hypothetical protein
MFHVKHFGTIDDLRKRTFGRRGAIRSGALEQAEEWVKVYFWPRGILASLHRRDLFALALGPVDIEDRLGQYSALALFHHG